MATLAEALQGLNYTGADTGYGIAATTLGQMTPQLITPYSSTGQALGISLGSVLLQSLLGYQARQQAARDTLELNTLANQLMTKATPEARTEFIGTVSDPMNQARLSTLSTALMQQEADRKAKAAEKLLELETEAGFELGPKGTELFKRKQQAELEKALALSAANRPVVRQQLPTGVQERIVDASTFAEAAQAHRNKIAQMSPVELKTLLTTGTSMFGLVGDPGFVSENEAVLQLYRKANFGATLTGQEKKAADIIGGKTLTASKADILAAWDTLINQSNRRAQKSIEVATSTPEGLRESLIQSEKQAKQPNEDNEARKAELRRQIAEMKVLLEQRRK